MTTQRYATTRNTTTLYSVGLRFRDGREYTQVASCVDRDQAIGWFTHHGVERRAAAEVVETAHDVAHSALARSREASSGFSGELALPRAIDGDLIDAVEIGPRGESYRVIATVVSAPGIPVA